jgi:hypothetical protein
MESICPSFLSCFTSSTPWIKGIDHPDRVWNFRNYYFLLHLIWKFLLQWKKLSLLVGNKAPGHDAINIFFIKKAWDIVGEAVNCNFTLLSQSACSANNHKVSTSFSFHATVPFFYNSFSLNLILQFLHLF